MFPVSLHYKDAMKRPSKTWDIKLSIKLSNGHILNITGKDIVNSTVQFTEGSTCTDRIQVGATFSNGFDFTLLNIKGQFSNYDFTNAEVAPSVGLWIEQKKDFEYVPLGIFNIVDSPKKLSTIAINCLDNMCKANVPFDFFDTVYPANAADVLRRACDKCGFTLSENFETEVRNLGIEIHSFETAGITCRDIIASASALISKNARFSRTNVLEAFWYSNDGAETTPSTRTGSSTYEDKTLQVTRVIISDNYEQAYAYGDEGYTIELSSNPFIQSPEIAESVLSRALERLRGVNVQQCTVCTIGDPSWQASDIVTHARPGFTNVTVPIMRIAYKYGGSMTLYTLGDAPEEVAQPTKQERKIMHLKDKNAKDYKNLDSKIEQTADSIKLEVSENYKNLDSKIEQTADSIKLEVTGGTPGSTAIIKLSVGEGPDAKTYTGQIDLTGLVTFQSLTSSGTTTIDGSRITTGKVQSKDGTTVIDLDDGEIHAVAPDYNNRKAQIKGGFFYAWDGNGKKRVTIGSQEDTAYIHFLNPSGTIIGALRGGIEDDFWIYCKDVNSGDLTGRKVGWRQIKDGDGNLRTCLCAY